MGFFNQGISLGKWFRISVTIHWLFLVYAAYRIVNAPEGQYGWQTLWIVLLFGTVLVHEFGHALSCRAVGGEAYHIVLWPLGGMAFVQPPMTPWAWLVTTVCGPLVNAVLWPVFWAVTMYGLPVLAKSMGEESLGFEVIATACIWMWQINKLLLLFNLIPAYPMDGGRILQELLWFAVGYPKSLMIAGMVGTVAGLGFVVIGLGLQNIKLPVLGFTLHGPDPMLAMIGGMCILESFGIYRRSQEIKGWRKDGGFGQ